MRHYIITCADHHYPLATSPKYVTATRARIREVSIVIFRRVFGREPNRYSWGKDGFMGGAACRRGYSVLVEQINDDELPGFDRRTGRFPLALVPQNPTEH